MLGVSCSSFAVGFLVWHQHLTMVRPNLGYGQHLTIRMVKGIGVFQHKTRRRLRGDLILAYNTFHGGFYMPQAELSEFPTEGNQVKP